MEKYEKAIWQNRNGNLAKRENSKKVKQKRDKSMKIALWKKKW